MPKYLRYLGRWQTVFEPTDQKSKASKSKTTEGTNTKHKKTTKQTSRQNKAEQTNKQTTNQNKKPPANNETKHSLTKKETRTKPEKAKKQSQRKANEEEGRQNKEKRRAKNKQEPPPENNRKQAAENPQSTCPSLLPNAMIQIQMQDPEKISHLEPYECMHNASRGSEKATAQAIRTHWTQRLSQNHAS